MVLIFEHPYFDALLVEDMTTRLNLSQELPLLELLLAKRGALIVHYRLISVYDLRHHFYIKVHDRLSLTNRPLPPQFLIIRIDILIQSNIIGHLSTINIPLDHLTLIVPLLGGDLSPAEEHLL